MLDKSITALDRKKQQFNMKRNPSRLRAVSLMTAASLALALSTHAGMVPTAEIPVQAASQVKAAKADQQEATTKTVVAKSISQKPAIAPAVVSAVAQAVPEMASVAAGVAVKQQPKQIGEITKAAVAAAPAQVSKIVSTICAEFPTKYNLVAIAAYEASPAAAKEILAAVASSVPSIKPLIARSAFSSLPSVIADTQSMLQAAVRAAKTTPEQFLMGRVVAEATPSYSPVALPPPDAGAPFTTPSGTPAEKNQGNTAIVGPGGGRDYSGG